MRNAILVSILATVMIVGAVAVYAGPPLAGTYKSTDNDFDEGVEASSWDVGGFLGAGNVLHAESRDPGTMALGDDWKILCPVVTNVSLIVDLVFGGNGQRIYLIEYAGGMIELGGGGPWGNGDPSYVGIIDSYYETRTVQYLGGVQNASVSDHAVSAHLQGYSSSCMTWGIGNGVWLGNGAVPVNYPDYRNAACAPGGNGHFGEIRDLTISVEGCAVSTEETTWGGVKALYRD